MLGKKHQAIADWLVIHWGKDERRVCVVEGFSGVGKTEVASAFERRATVDARVDAPESGVLDDLLLSLSEQLAANGHFELANAINDGKSLEAAFEAVLLKPVRIVVDEFQRMVDMSTAAPIPRVAALIERISKRTAPGRLLLLSHHSLDKTTRWGERIAFKPLEGLSPAEGAQLLSELLGHRNRLADIPAVRRPDISRWLGGNPRAIRVLVGALEEQALDDLTGVIPEAWEGRDQQVSESLIAKLERELLVRALENLDGPSASSLEAIAVYRQTVPKAAIARLVKPGLDVDQFLMKLSSRFLLEQRAGGYSLNSVVREISLHRLKESPRAAQIAHRAAASNYTRHFTSKQIVNAGKLGGAFVEARYHLVQGGNIEELAEIVHSYGEHLRARYSWVTAAAHDEVQLDEAIGVLSAYLQSEGPRSMHYQLARLLEARGRPEDNERALEHARKSTGSQSPASAWVLRIRLEATIAGIQPMIQATKQAIAAVPADENLSTIYQIAGEKLAQAGLVPQGLDLLEEGIGKIRPDKGVWALYLAEANILAGSDQVADGIILLRQALTIIPAEHNLFAIYDRVANLLAGAGRQKEAVELLVDGIGRIPPDKGLYVLYITLAEMYAAEGDRVAAVRQIDEGLQKVPIVDRASLRSARKRISVQSPGTSSETTEGSNEEIQPPSQKEAVAEGVLAARRSLHILAVGTEWESRHGGLSTFNRELCIALAAGGHRVVCVVPEATESERQAAKSSGVELYSPDAEAGLDGTELLLLEISLPPDFEPDLVMGHDRKTGPHAKVLTRRFKTARFVLFVHTRPEDIEWHKDKLGADDAATTAEVRKTLQKELASGAALVVGVGPALTESARSLVYLANPRPHVHRLDPGFRIVPRPSDPPPQIQCLLMGRVEDYELKGLDIAALAIGKVTQRNKLPRAPRMIVRGAPPGTGLELRKRLVESAGGKLEVEIRDYSADSDRLQQDILMASVMLMPSRSEGFGLVALEAIASGTPVLVTDVSGIADLLNERVANAAKGIVIETRDDVEWSAQEWERGIEKVLSDRDAAFTRAKALQETLSSVLTWEQAVRGLEAAWSNLISSDH